MNDIEKAKTLLASGRHTCVLCHGDTLFTSSLPGIAPMMGFIASGQDLRGFSAADKIVGRAASLLFAYAGITEVHAVLLSDGGAAALKARDIRYSFETRAAFISNRSGDGVCPMEVAVAGIDDPREAYIAIMKRLEEMKKPNSL